MKGVPWVLFTLKCVGVTNFLRTLNMSHLIFLTSVSVYISGMCFGNFEFVKSKKCPVNFVLRSNRGE